MLFRATKVIGLLAVVHCTSLSGAVSEEQSASGLVRDDHDIELEPGTPEHTAHANFMKWVLEEIVANTRSLDPDILLPERSMNFSGEQLVYAATPDPCPISLRALIDEGVELLTSDQTKLRIFKPGPLRKLLFATVGERSITIGALATNYLMSPRDSQALFVHEVQHLVNFECPVTDPLVELRLRSYAAMEARAHIAEGAYLTHADNLKRRPSTIYVDEILKVYQHAPNGLTWSEYVVDAYSLLDLRTIDSMDEIGYRLHVAKTYREFNSAILAATSFLEKLHQIYRNWEDEYFFSDYENPWTEAEHSAVRQLWAYTDGMLLLEKTIKQKSSWCLLNLLTLRKLNKLRDDFRNLQTAILKRLFSEDYLQRLPKPQISDGEQLDFSEYKEWLVNRLVKDGFENEQASLAEAEQQIEVLRNYLSEN